jgi:hypothetical protein
MNSPIKVCSICQTDLDGKKRVKDSEGNYFCPRCWEARTSLGAMDEKALPVASASVATTPGLSVASRPSPARPSASSSVQSTPRDVPPALRRKAIMPPLVMGGILTVLGWAGYIACAVFHYDIFATGNHSVGDDHAGMVRNEFYLALAVILTLVGTVGAGLVARSHLYTVRYGRLVAGRIAGLATMAYKGARKVVVEYEVDGKTYEYQSSEGGVPVALNMGLGDAVTVYAHPRKPGRAVVLWEAPPAGV